MIPAVLLLVAAPAPREPAPSVAALTGTWRVKYHEMRGTLTLRRDGAFGWETKDTVTAGTWGFRGRTLWLRWEAEYSRNTGRCVWGFGGATDSLVRVRRGAWAPASWKTPVLFFYGRVK